MRAIASLSVLVVLPALVAGEETVRTFSWRGLADTVAPAGVEVRPAGAGAPFEHAVVSSAGGPRTVTLLTVRDPGVQRSRYAIKGQVRYEGVEGSGYLEMWSRFPQGRFFSRTLEASGPLGSLHGSSDWRPFVLPFFNEPGGAPPQELTVNLVLAGRGTVAVGPLRLVQFGDDENPLAGTATWWSGRAGGLVGAVTGSLIGCLGALIGVLGGLGRARRLVLGLLKAMLVFGVIALALGVVALLRSQPYEVFYPPLIVGIICSTVPLFSLPALRRRYEQLELRRMQALDAR